MRETMRTPRLLPAVIAGLLCAACAPLTSPRTPPPVALASNAPTVGLLATGSACERPETPARIARAIEQATGRRVVRLPAPSAADDPTLKQLAARVAHEKPALAGYNWKEPRCSGRMLALAGAQADVVAVYRVALDVTTRARPAEPIDDMRLPPRGWSARDLRDRLGLGGPPSVVEETVAGALVTSTVAQTTATEHVPLKQSALHRAPLAPEAGLDPGPMVAEAVKKQPTPRPPRWDAVASKLVSDGCPFLGLAVAEARLPRSKASDRIRQAAFAAMSRHAKTRGAKEGTRTGAVEETPPQTEEAAAPEPPADDRYSCTALCGMHMVELCNNDRELWKVHRERWEATPCGVRRPEDFLADCYKQQWLTGTYQDSCVIPCETTLEGHDKLVTILQASGCLRGTS